MCFFLSEYVAVYLSELAQSVVTWLKVGRGPPKFSHQRNHLFSLVNERSGLVGPIQICSETRVNGLLYEKKCGLKVRSKNKLKRGALACFGTVFFPEESETNVRSRAGIREATLLLSQRWGANLASKCVAIWIEDARNLFTQGRASSRFPKHAYCTVLCCTALILQGCQSSSRAAECSCNIIIKPILCAAS
jgi:hypothetical protein